MTEKTQGRRPRQRRQGPAHRDAALALLRVELVDDRRTSKGWLVRCLDCDRPPFEIWAARLSLAHSSPPGSVRGCRDCSYRTRNADLRLDDEVARARAAEVEAEPLEPYPGVHARWRLRCLRCQHEWPARMGNLQNRQSRCPRCADRERGRARRLPSDDVVALFAAADLVPDMAAYAGVDEPLPSVHTVCGRKVTPSVSNVARLGRGCRFCGLHSTEAEPGVLYLLWHPEQDAYKIGVSIQKPRAEPRWLMFTRRYGFQVVGLWPAVDKIAARRVEQAVLRWVRGELQLPAAMSGFVGSTETFSADGLPLPDLRRRIEQLRVELIGEMLDSPVDALYR